jgi:hypothetical protein
LFFYKASRNYAAYDIKKGDVYYRWSLKRGTKINSKQRPRPSQLTRSEFLGNIYEAQESLEDAIAEFRKGESTFEDLAAACEDAAVTGRVRRRKKLGGLRGVQMTDLRASKQPPLPRGEGDEQSDEEQPRDRPLDDQSLDIL